MRCWRVNCSVNAVDLRAGQRVLDWPPTGSGNTALAAARHSRHVTRHRPTSRRCWERARERAAAERLPVTFHEGDAEHLPVPDGAFDVMLSTFGVMFAPDQAQAAGEGLLLLCRPGGKIGGLPVGRPTALRGRASASRRQYVPPPPGVPPASVWGTEEGVRALWGAGVTSLHCNAADSFIFRYRSAPRSSGSTFGPTLVP